MADQVFNPLDDDRLLDLAVAIADGTPIDWATATPSGSASEASSLAVRLQCLERLVRGHEAIRSQSSRPTLAAHETVLTEARRQADSRPDQALRVQWGPRRPRNRPRILGDVYRAWDPCLDREVALKLIPRTPPTGRLLSSKKDGCSRASGIPSADGPRCRAYRRSCRHRNRVHVRGETLAQEIARRGPVSVGGSGAIGIEVCRALAAVHRGRCSTAT